MKNVITSAVTPTHLTELYAAEHGMCFLSLFFVFLENKVKAISLGKGCLQLPMDVPLHVVKRVSSLWSCQSCSVPWLNSECIVDTYLGTCVLGWEQTFQFCRRKWEQLMLELLKQKSLNPGEPLRSQSRSRLKEWTDFDLPSSSIK